MAWQRKTPFGYMVQGGETVPCPAEADAVQGIFAHYLAGASYGRIAEEMSRGNVPYHQHTRQWNKHMVKRILENGKYLGTGGYPRLISDENFLAVQLQREDKTDYAPCPAGLGPIREKAVCAVCGSRITRDTKSHGQLANTPDLLVPPPTPEVSPSADALRIQNELNLCFNRSDINPDYMKTLIFAAAAEQYAVLPDLTPVHDMEVLRNRLKTGCVNDSDLQELLAKAEKAVRIGGQDYIELELTNGTMIRKEQVT